MFILKVSVLTHHWKVLSDYYSTYKIFFHGIIIVKLLDAAPSWCSLSTVIRRWVSSLELEVWTDVYANAVLSNPLRGAASCDILITHRQWCPSLEKAVQLEKALLTINSWNINYTRVRNVLCSWNAWCVVITILIASNLF